MISYEFFPPKTPAGQENLLATAKQLAETNADFFSVTFGAGGSTRAGTLETLTTLQNTLTTEVVPHLSCIGLSKNDLQSMLDQYAQLQIKKIVALRGDLPSGTGADSELRYANELVAFIRHYLGDEIEIIVAAYPEYHPQSKTSNSDILNLKNKFLAGANTAITQYFFNADAYFHLRDEATKVGINNRIIPGIMPITNFHQLVQFSAMCGAEVPRWLFKRLEYYQHDLAALKAFGTEVIVNLCRQLLEGGVDHLHFYTLNRAESCLQIVRGLAES